MLRLYINRVSTERLYLQVHFPQIHIRIPRTITTATRNIWLEKSKNNYCLVLLYHLNKKIAPKIHSKNIHIPVDIHMSEYAEVMRVYNAEMPF